MNRRRLALYLALLVLLAVPGYGLVLWALFACAPPPLPGDELWTWRQNVAAALDLILRLGSTACFTADTGGRAALWLGTRTAGALLGIVAAIALWETLGRNLRLRWFRARGGHALLAGSTGDLAGLIARRGRFAGTVLLAPDAGAALDLGRLHPFSEIVTVAPKALSRQLARLGILAARLVAATTRNDLANVAIAEAALEKPGTGDILLRLEQGSVRALSAHRLRQRAERAGRTLSVVSLTHLQTRRGMAAAMSGRYGVDGEPRVHIALCGTGEGLQAAAMEVVRQGFGLETARPLVSILRTGSADFAAGALERLADNEAVELRVATAFAAATGGLDKAITGIVLDSPPLLAVHCLGVTPEEAEAMALRWEEVLLALDLPVPPIIAYAAEDRPLGSTGMIRVAVAPDLADAADLARLMDARAMAVHAEFLAAQRAARGAQFGTAPAEADWAHLPEGFRDDNRNVADQMDYKLARIFMLSRPGTGNAALTPDELETLAELAHARWWAAKALGGWRFGDKRDDRALLHPDMLPYDRLSEPVKQKDRDEVASLPAMAGLAGEALQRERRVAIPRPLTVPAAQTLLKNLAATPKTQIPVAVIAVVSAEQLDLAAMLHAAGIAIEAVLDGSVEALRRDEASVAGLAAVLRAAWRIQIAAGRDAASSALARSREQANQQGGIDALA